MPHSPIGFDALTIEGGLLPPEWLSLVATQEAGEQSAGDYGLGPEHTGGLRDAINRAWSAARVAWRQFDMARTGADDDAGETVAWVETLLGQCLGFESLVAEPGPAHTALGGRVPVVITPAGIGLDGRDARWADGGYERSAFGYCQEQLNARASTAWGLVSNGLQLRLLRATGRLTRPAWIQADLVRIFEDDAYPDFAALWLLVHQSRFGPADAEPDDSTLERWRAQGRQRGTRARQRLREGVEAALLAFGEGFLAHPDNGALRRDLSGGTLGPSAYFQQLLRLVYRLIFLLGAEERQVLFAPDADATARERYAQGYGMRRLRDRAVGHGAHDRHHDVFEGVKVVFRCLVEGEAALGLPALGGLFAPDRCPALDAARLENRFAMQGMRHLSWFQDQGSSLSRVNWRDMGPEELGSVYESLLELVPQVSDHARSFSFASSDGPKGSTRKSTGSYYTPESLVQVVLDRALEPVVAKTLADNPGREAETLLELTIVDPACGSGHFLLGAARRLASHVARLQSGGTPTVDAYRHALRRVVSRCIYGVDLNPMAVELCTANLWMEALEPGHPVPWLDSHIRHGNALLGTTPSLVAAGLPDDAWKPLDGDDKEAAKLLRKRNRSERDATQAEEAPEPTGSSLAEAMTALEALPEDDAPQLARKRARWQEIREGDAYRHARSVADMWCAAFVWPKQSGEATDVAPTHATLRQALAEPLPADSPTRSMTRALAQHHGFFHWPLEFPHVFARGGFDVVLGNPPWDTLSPDAKEFFAAWDPQVRFLTPAEQKQAIATLRKDPIIDEAWARSCRDIYAAMHFIKRSGRYALFAPGNLGKGDFNVFRMFVETALSIVREGGRCSQIVPEGLYNGANCMAIREALFERSHVELLLGFENARHAWFDNVDSRTKFCLYVAQLPGETEQLPTAFVIRGPRELATALTELRQVPVSLVREFSPHALALMEFATQADIDVARKVYAGAPRFGDAVPGQPHRHYMRELDMGNDRHLFDADPAGIAVYEGRMVAHYDHRAKGYRSGRGRKAVWEPLAFGSEGKVVDPQWRLAPTKLPAKLEQRYDRYRIGFCDVASPTNERTLVAALIPSGVVCGHKVPTIVFEGGGALDYALWLGLANTFVMDFLARMKVSLSMTYTVLDSLPFVRSLEPEDVAFVARRVARLTGAGAGVAQFSTDVDAALRERGVAAQALTEALEPEQRLRLTSELEAFFALRCHGLSRDELAHVLDSFLIVRRKDTQAHGEYRTQRVILECYDAMVSES